MKENSIASRTEIASLTKSAVARCIRRGRHLRRHPITKLRLAAVRLLGGADYLSELIFWENVLAHRPMWLFDQRKRDAAFPIDLRQRLSARPAGAAPAEVLEVGSGPVSLLAAGVDEGRITVTAIDPLASLYAVLLRECRIRYPIVPVTGCGERLREQFGDQRFDAVYSSNALDHTKSPQRCLIEMSGIVRKGGWIVLEGFVREGSNAGWAGLHQHDLLPEDGHLIRCDRHGSRENLTHGLGLDCVTWRVVPFKDRGIRGFGYELPPHVPEDADWKWNLRNWYTLVFRKG